MQTEAGRSEGFDSSRFAQDYKQKRNAVKKQGHFLKIFHLKCPVYISLDKDTSAALLLHLTASADNWPLRLSSE